MHRLRWQDRVALWLLSPLWLACFAASLLSLDRPVTLVPFYVDPAPDVSVLPVVRGLPPWADRSPKDATGAPDAALPRAGDRVVEIGGEPAAGAGRSRVAALAWEQTSNQGELAVLLERDGARIETVLRTPVQPKWPLLPVAIGFAGMATIGLLLVPQQRLMQVSYPALMTTAFWMVGYFGSGPGTQLAAFWIRFAAFTFMMPLYVRALRHFPSGDDERVRWARGWPVVLGLNGVAIANTELFGLVPSSVSHGITHLLMAVGALLALTVAVLSYRSAGARVRRRFRWLLLGSLISYLPTLAAVILRVAGVHPGETWLASQLAMLAVPIAAAIGVLRDDLVDVDRALAASVLLSVFGATALLGLGIGVPASAEVLSAQEQLTPSTAHLLATVACVGALAGVGYGLWRVGRRVLLRAEAELEREVESLTRQVSRCHKLRELAALLGDRLPELWRTTGAVVYAGSGGAREDEREDAFDGASSALVPVHAHGSVAVSEELPLAWRTELVEGDQPRMLSAADAAREATPEAAIALLLPIRRGGELALVVALGAKRNGDLFTSHDRALLAALGARTAAVLERLAHGELLGAAKRLNEELLHDRDALARDRVELMREREELGRASENKSTLLATAGHDLRQPLHAMELFLAALEERVTDETSRALLLRARSSARALEQTFDGLLDAARLDAGVLRPELRDLALAPLFAELEHDARPIAEARGLRLRVRASELAVHSDPLLLRSVLQNLLGNALRYTARGGVLVGARRRGGEVRIEIWDTGPGIAPEEQDRLFRAWERGETSSNTQGDAGDEARAGSRRDSRGDSGSGLGLALATRMTEALGHRLELHSWPGRGSVFSLSAPPATPAAAARAGHTSGRTPGTRRITRPDGARPVIALIEDDGDALAALDALLSAWGVDVLPATSLDALLGVLGAAPRQPDALITDLHLGGGASGLEAIAQLRAACAGPVPAIVVSADRSTEAEARVRATGHLLLRKPVEPARLRAALAHLLG